MLTYNHKNNKTFNQKSYNNFIDTLNSSCITCPCGSCGDVIFWGRYTRKIKKNGELITISIQRVFCRACNKTHAILPDIIIPYMQTLIKDAIILITGNKDDVDALLIRNILIDESTYKYIRLMYKRHWKEKLISFDIDIHSIKNQCIELFCRQFMQIKRTLNKLL